MTEKKNALKFLFDLIVECFRAYVYGELQHANNYHYRVAE